MHFNPPSKQDVDEIVTKIFLKPRGRSKHKRKIRPATASKSVKKYKSQNFINLLSKHVVKADDQYLNMFTDTEKEIKLREEKARKRVQSGYIVTRNGINKNSRNLYQVNKLRMGT
mmetsp:Transcript_17339/g.15306  ORF Transcript_17339/g.15306 Transcript_17339/m.15306 type:complete len:115 (+) Transcript_17339:305-649(+)